VLHDFVEIALQHSAVGARCSCYRFRLRHATVEARSR